MSGARKGTSMGRKRRCRGVVLAGGLAALLAGGAAWSEGRFNLKAGGLVAVCTPCHSDFEDKLKSPFVHTPVKAGECQGCHNPHASSFGKMLDANPDRLCFQCHAAVVPAGALSSHEPVLQGGCVKCHDPHAAKNKANLVQTGNVLCLGCHKTMGDKVANAKFGHEPVKESCLNCHKPHGSAKAPSLLAEGVPSLCLGCHDAAGQDFLKRHGGYPVGKARCTSCHDPHGSDVAGLLLGNFHKPVANKQCGLCHEAALSQTPFATKKKGLELCRGCHSNLVSDVLGKSRMHAALLGDASCGGCHAPHASKEKALLRQPLLELCGKCHADTIARQQKSATPHPPIAKGNCTACHTPHASETTYLLKDADVKEVCGTCHDWHKHSTHPIGDKIVDPRNKNLTVQCTSCHRTHGTEYKHMFYYATVSELCTQCHTQFQR